MTLSSNLTIRGAGAQLVNWAREGGMPREVLVCGPRGTSKSVSIWAFILMCGQMWPGSRILICRKTRASMTQSVCVTLEKILGPDHEMLKGATKEHRTNYWIGPEGTGTEIVLASLENTDRLYSTEWDIVWVEEVREIGRGAWEKFIGNMRNFKMPFQLMLGSTNPDAPGHWAYQRFKQQKITYLKSVHEDNPGYFDLIDGKFVKTEQGAIYLEGLQRLTGTEYRRNYLGEWVASEGAIFPTWNPESDVVAMDRDSEGWVTKDCLDKLGITSFYGGCDFGWDAPGSLSIWGYGKGRKHYRLAEVYRTRRQISWWADRLCELHAHYPLELLFCDPSRPDAIEHFNDKLMVPSYGPGAIAVKADNDIFQGLQVCRDELEGGRCFFDRNAMYGGPHDAPTDENLAGAGLPTCTEDEIPSYVYARKALEDDDATGVRKDEPDKASHEHGCDAWRYRAMGTRYLDPSVREIARRPVIRPGSCGDLFGHAEWFDKCQEADELRAEIEALRVGFL